MLTCPVCHAPLQPLERSFSCANHHCFDRAKSGYVNLLLPNQKHAKIPGDNKQMVDARTRFLDGGYYLPLVEALGALLASFPGGNVLDAGCGEGYYTDRLTRLWEEKGISANTVGVDISKFALDRAAKRSKTPTFAVGSIFHLPIADESCDLLLNLFAPYCAEEFLRVVKPGGLFCMVIPGERHLWELKEALYDEPYPNEVRDFALEGWELADHAAVDERIMLHSAADIADLFAMTPYYYKTSKEGSARGAALETLSTRISFELLLYRKRA